MKKFLSFLTAILFAGSMMAANYVKTAYADIQTDDVVIITMQNADGVYAASNDQGSSKAPVATEVTVADDAITTDATNILWTVTKDGANITFNAGDKALYCISSNNGVRVGSNENNVFTIDAESGYLFNNATSRYIGVYNSQDFRCYTSVNSNIKDQTLAFFVLDEGGEGGETISTVKTVYCKAAQAWWKVDNAAVGIYAFKGEVKNAAWPGVRMTAVEGETDLWKADIDTAKYEKIIFTRVNASGDIADWGAKTADLTVPADKDLYTITSTDGVWGDPGVTGEWSVYAGEEPAPVADFTQPFVLKFNGTGESGKDNSAAFAADVAAIFDAASAPYVESVETATKIYAGRPIADDNSSVKFGTNSAAGSLAFTLAQAIEVDSIIVNATQYGNNAAKITVNGTEFDLTAGNKVPQDSKITPEGAVSVITIAQSGTERIYLRNIRVYPKNQGGDTPEEIVLPVVKLAGSLTSWSEPALMVNAEDSLSASVTLNLGIDHYQLKVVSDDNWLSKAGDGDLYTMHRDWNHVDHLDLINTGDNIKLITDVEGAYTFTWTYADSTLVVTFPEAPAKPNYYLIGDSAFVVDAGATADKAWTPDAIPSFQDTTVLNLKAGVDYIMRLSLEGTWENHRDFRHLTDTAAGLIELPDEFGNHSIGFRLAEAGEVQVVYIAAEGENPEIFKLIGKFYVEPTPEPAKFYVTGNEALVGAELAWNPSAIKSMNDTLVLNLKAETDYVLKVTVNGTWEGENNVKGYNELTEKTAGLKDLSDDHNIGFRLAEAGEVKVVYIAAEGENLEIFKLIGNFFVEPTPEPAKFYVTGDSALVTDAGFAGKAWNPDAIKAEADTLVLNLKAEQVYKLKVTTDGTWNTAKGFNDLTEKPEGVTTDNDGNIIFSLAEAGAVKVIYIAGETPIFKIAGNFYVEPTPPTVENGFYLVGSMNDWTASAEYKFAVNPGNENEYVLQVTLDVNDELKVKKVEEGQADVWFPAEGGNYIIDDHHDGATTIYFRPDYQGGEDWFAGCIYVRPTSTVGFENTAVDAKAVKVLKNGILVIEKNNKTYNVMGQMVK